MAVVWIIVAVVVVVLAYWRWDVWRRPHVPCRICKGSGGSFSRLGGGVLRKPFGKCWCCKGAKSHPRLAARILTPGQYKAIRDGKSGRNHFLCHWQLTS
jgi:hypothetical protein